MEEEYKIKFPKIQVNFTKPQLFFLINNIKSRRGSVLYFKLYCYNKSNEVIYTYTSPRWVITDSYLTKSRMFEISDDIYEKVFSTQIELIAINNSSENPLYFTECMFSEYDGDDAKYHKPNEALDRFEVGMVNSRYVNLYDRDGNFMQVIRPDGKNIFTDTISASTCTVLAPHLYQESDIDDPVDVFLEFINQTEQVIDVLR